MEEGEELLRNAMAADNTEEAYILYVYRDNIPIGRCGSAECQLMQAWLMWPARTDAMFHFWSNKFSLGEHKAKTLKKYFRPQIFKGARCVTLWFLGHSKVLSGC